VKLIKIIINIPGATSIAAMVGSLHIARTMFSLTATVIK
jgi:hypothetical protein